MNRNRYSLVLLIMALFSLPLCAQNRIDPTQIQGTAAVLNVGTTYGVPVYYANVFSGANAGIKIAACLAAAAYGVCDARGLTGAQSSTVNPFSGIASPVTLELGGVNITTTVAWIITHDAQNIIGESYTQTILHCSTSVTNCLYWDGSGVANNATFIARNLQVIGNSGVVNAVHLSSVDAFTLENVLAVNASGAGIRCTFCITGQMINPIVSTNKATYTTIPAKGMYFTDLDTSHASVGNTITNPIVEGLTGSAGIYLDFASHNTFIGGTSESNALGIVVNGTLTGNPPLDCQANIFELIHLEGNTTRDVSMTSGFQNQFIGISASSSAGSIQFGASSLGDMIIGGFYDQPITTLSGADHVKIYGTSTNNLITDGGVRTVWHDVWDSTYIGPSSGGYIPDKLNTTLLFNVTADSSGAAGTLFNPFRVIDQNNGNAVVFDAGADVLGNGFGRVFDHLGNAGIQLKGAATSLFSNYIQTLGLSSNSNCASSANPAVCGSSSAGRFVIPAGGTSVQVNTVLVGANTEIKLTRDNSLGSALSVTCNTQSSLVLGTPYVSSRGSSNFTVSVDVAPTTDPLCMGFSLIN